MLLLFSLPIFTFIATAILLAGSYSHQKKEPPGWPDVLIWSSALTGMYLVLISELLSLFERLTLAWIVGVWSIPLIAIGMLVIKTEYFTNGLRFWRDQWAQLLTWPLIQRMILAALFLEAAILLAVALKAAPNTADSLLYHMSRVAHWRQNHSLDHYAAIYNHQLWSPIFSELSILHLVTLWGADVPANLVQFVSMLGSLAVVAGITRQLGGRRSTQLLACLLAFSPPMMLLQATSTQTDFVAGYWAVATLYLLMRLLRSHLARLDWVALGAVVGLGMLTKVTYYPFLGLVIVGAFVLAWRRRYPVRQLFVGGITLTVLAVALNLGFWIRNMETYGTPLGDAGMLASSTNFSLDPRAPLAGSLQHLALNFIAPWPRVNEGLINLVTEVSDWLGQPSQTFEILWGWNHEDLAGNPVHVSILLASLAIAMWPTFRERRLKWYAAALIVSFLGFCWAVEAGVHRVRYQVPWLLMGAPLSASIMARWLGSRTIRLFSLLFLILALPWILFNQTRPVIGWQPRTRTGSVFLSSRAESLFANATRARQPFSEAANAATSDSCSQIGLRIDDIDIEYAFWWLLEQENPDVKVKILEPAPELAALRSPEFDPCAIICTNCRTDSIQGLDLIATYENVKVYK